MIDYRRVVIDHKGGIDRPRRGLPFIRSLLSALVGSLAANLLVLFVFRPLVIDPAMPLNALSVVPVTAFTVVGVTGATIVYAVMRSLLAQPDPAFVGVAIAVLLVSFLPDYMIIGQTTGMFAGGNVGSALVLMLMHVVTAILAVWSLVRLWGRRPVARPPTTRAM